MNSLQNIKTLLCALIGTIGGFVMSFLGGGDSLLLALFIFMCIDFATGIFVALFWQNSNKSETGGLSSKACWRGIVKKISTFLLVGVANQADILIGVDYIRNAIIVAFCVSELISILENAGEMGILSESVQNIFNKVIDVLSSKVQTHAQPDSDTSVTDSTDIKDGD